jgi:hypothetical protein
MFDEVDEVDEVDEATAIFKCTNDAPERIPGRCPEYPSMSAASQKPVPSPGVPGEGTG